MTQRTKRLNPVECVECWSRDGRFGIVLPEEQQECIRRECETANGSETGGILVGTYNDAHDCAFVSEVFGPPEDSKGGRFTFFRGVKGLQGILRRIWKEQRRYYLGEWHFHPGGSPIPSGTDNDQMTSIAQDPLSKCPEPILVILGGNPKADWTIGAFVYTRTDGPIELIHGQKRSA